MIGSIHAIFGKERRPLATIEEDTPTVVPAAYLTLVIEGENLPPSVVLDGSPIALIKNEAHTRGYLMLDTFRSVGFHQLEIEDKAYIFGTDDAKLQMSGIQKILDYIEAEGLSWGLQLFFADGTAIRHAKVDYAWLSVAGPKIVRLAHDISEKPLRRREIVPWVGKPRAGKLFVQETLQLLRRNPRTLLEEHPEGSILVGDVHYFPRAAVIGKAVSSFNIVGNRRVTWLLRECIKLAAFLRAEVSKLARRNIVQAQEACERALQLFPFAQLSLLPPGLTHGPSPEEIADERYSEIYRLYEELTRELGWQPSVRLSSRFGYVKYADEIYQAFVAITLAHAFQTSQITDSLISGLETPVFRSAEYEIYYDTIPPKRWFLNWRDASSRPAEMRPDLVLVNLPQQKGILLDAKYRVEKSGRVSTSALNDCQTYMQSFGTKIIGVCYPGDKLQVTDVSGYGNTILEISISPVPGLQEYLLKVVRPKILAEMESLHA